MADHEKKTGQEGYESADLRINVVTTFLSAVAALTFVTIILMIVMMRGFFSHSERTREPGSPLDTAGAQLPDPTGPRLQQDPVAERKQIVAEAEEELNSYELTKESGVEDGADQVHIPITRAIELVGSGQAPYRQAPKTAALDGAEE